MSTVNYASRYASSQKVEDVKTFSGPTEGRGYARLLEAVLVGPQYAKFEGNATFQRPRVRLVFELSGKAWPEVNGERPKITRSYGYTPSARGSFAALWKNLNWKKNVNNVLQLVGEPYIVVLSKPVDETKTALELEVLPPHNMSADGEIVDLSASVPALSGTPCAFDYDLPYLDDWDALYRSGHSDDGKSYNYTQNDIRSAAGFPSGALADMLRQDGRDIWTDYEAGKEVPGSRLRNVVAVKENFKKNGFIPPSDYFTDTPVNKPAAAAAAEVDFG